MPSVKITSPAINCWPLRKYSRTRVSMVPNSAVACAAWSTAALAAGPADDRSAASTARAASARAAALGIQNSMPCPAAT